MVFGGWAGAMETALTELAETQHGLVTTAQALALGVSDRQLLRLKHCGSIHSVARSLYSVRPLPTDDEERLRLETRAALLLYLDADPVGASALALQNVPLFALRSWRVDVARPVRHEILTQLCRIRPRCPLVRPPAETASPASAVVQTTLDHGHVAGVVAADRLLHTNAISAEELRLVGGAVAGWPHSSRVRTMLALMNGASESVGETRMRLFVQAMGWRVVPQFKIEDEGGVFAYVDLLVDGTNLCLEFDGRLKYGSGIVVWFEKKREDRARRLGYVFERLVWADFATPVALGERLRRARRAAEERPSVLDRPRHSA